VVSECLFAGWKLILFQWCMSFAGPAMKNGLIDLDHCVGMRLAFRMASLDLRPADPASVELTTRCLGI